MPTDADRFARKAETAASEAERAAWLAAAAAAGERDRLRNEVDAITALCWYPVELDDGRWVNRLNIDPQPDDDHDFDEDDKAGIVAAVRRAAGLDTGGGSDG